MEKGNFLDNTVGSSMIVSHDRDNSINTYPKFHESLLKSLYVLLSLSFKFLVIHCLLSDLLTNTSIS